MKRITRRLAVVGACAVTTAAFTGIAVAGNVAGKAAAPGREKNADAAQMQTDAQASVEASATAQEASGASADRSAGRSDSAHPAASGRLKDDRVKQEQSAQSTAAAAATTDTSAGVKPSNTTTAVKWTHCVTGGSPGAATCTAVAPTPNVKPDVSKQYGDGTTAARIAVGRGGTGVTLTGPGNSQPHKVSACGKPSNPSGGVDVHAVKSYNPAACRVAAQQPVVQVTVARTTPPVTQQTAIPPSSSAVQVPNMQAGPATQTGPATQPTASASAAPSQSNGGVLAAQTSSAKPKAKPAGGVLGEVTNVSGSTLPFTGFPVWAAVLAALGLIGGGLVLRRSGSTTHV